MNKIRISVFAIVVVVLMIFVGTAMAEDKPCNPPPKAAKAKKISVNAELNSLEGKSKAHRDAIKAQEAKLNQFMASMDPSYRNCLKSDNPVWCLNNQRIKHPLVKMVRKLQSEIAELKKQAEEDSETSESSELAEKRFQAKFAQIDKDLADLYNMVREASDTAREAIKVAKGADQRADEAIGVANEAKREVEGVKHDVREIKANQKKFQRVLKHELLGTGFVDSKDGFGAFTYNLVVPVNTEWAMGAGLGFGPSAIYAGGPSYIVRIFGENQLNDWYGLRFGLLGVAETRASTGAFRGSSINGTLGVTFTASYFFAELSGGVGVERSSDTPYTPVPGSPGKLSNKTENSFNYMGLLSAGVRIP